MVRRVVFALSLVVSVLAVTHYTNTPATTNTPDITTGATNTTPPTPESDRPAESRPVTIGAHTLQIADDHPNGYDRDLFDVWTDTDGDQCNTRDEVLIRDTRTPAQIDPYRCTVLAGDWHSWYDNTTWTDPTNIDIDHVVALNEAWRSGAWSWTDEQRSAFANDLTRNDTLQAVTDTVNQTKGDLDPADWLPPDPNVRCRYINMWMRIKTRWELTVDPVEAAALKRYHRRCTHPTNTTPAATAPDTTATPAASTQPDGTPSGTPTSTAGAVTYTNCDAVRAADAAPIRRGEPGYSRHLDRDGDGIGCE
jgi:hypothetical protein